MSKNPSPADRLRSARKRLAALLADRDKLYAAITQAEDELADAQLVVVLSSLYGKQAFYEVCQVQSEDEPMRFDHPQEEDMYDAIDQLAVARLVTVEWHRRGATVELTDRGRAEGKKRGHLK